IVAARREGARHERPEARNTETLGTRVTHAGLALDVMPCRTRTGIEQHTDDGKIDPGAGARRRIAARQCAIELGGAIDATCLEMTPAAVIGNVQIGIAATRYGVHACGCDVEAERTDDVGGRGWSVVRRGD